MMLKHTCARVFLLVCLAVPLATSAAPKQIKAVYEATRNGQPFATVTETYREESGRYRIESVTQGLGVYALFGKRILTSEGQVTAEGLRPSHFELHRGDNPKKSLIADFDWSANQLRMTIKDKPVVVPLRKGAQDLASFPYQFMFTPPQGSALKLPVTTGKKLHMYQYKVSGRDVAVDVPAGRYKAIHLVNADVMEPEDEKELWLATQANYLPVRLIMHDDDGGRIEQKLTSLDVE
jgi:hypothetical protein